MPKGVIMRPEEYHTSRVVELFDQERILTFDSIAEALGRPSRITIFRKLAQLGARASYSHRGRYQTLDRIAEYNKSGLWSFRGVRFSRQGTLLQTILYLVKHSMQGYFASELQALVQVRVHNALARLYGAKLLDREQLVDQYLYVSPVGGKDQLESRYEAIQQAHQRESAAIEEAPENLCESMRLLLSALNEKQRRLYLGLESIRLGYGGDVRISQIAGVNVKTVAQGRRQLLARNVTAERIREVGAGRPALKKKPRDGTSGRTDASGHGRRSHE
jgi:hypothetical protein